MSVTNKTTGETTLVGVVLIGKQYRYFGDGDGYHYITYWDEARGKPEYLTVDWNDYESEVEFTVDATDDVKAKYAAFLEEVKRQADERKRRQDIREKLVERRYWIEASSITGLPYTVVRTKLRENKLIRNLLTTNVRSEFKKSLKKQVLDWLQDPAPKFNFPLSPKQLDYLVPVAYGYAAARKRSHALFVRSVVR